MNLLLYYLRSVPYCLLIHFDDSDRFFGIMTLTIDGNLTNDLMEVMSYTFGLSVLRLTLSGATGYGLNEVPCLFQLFSKGLHASQARKLHENLWYTVWHITSFGIGVWHLVHQPWVYDLFFRFDSEAVVSGYPQTALSMGFKQFYLFELGFWFSCCLFLGIETKRRDFVQMIVHHTSTIILVTFSYLFDFTRGGILIMILHDVGDVFLYSAKTAQYRRIHGLADLLFGFFVVAFFVARLFLLPVALLYPLVLSLYRGVESPGMAVIIGFGRWSTLAILTSVFAVLIGLHLMWGTIIARMVVRIIRSRGQKTPSASGVIPDQMMNLE